MEQKLEKRFLEIIRKHMDGLWASQELHWEVFIKHYYDFERLSEEDQWVVRNYMDALVKIYG